MTNEDLIAKAAAIVKPNKTGEFQSGTVGCALVTDRDNLYLGVCIDASSGMGFCAEHNAIGSMITNGEYVIKKIVAVAKDNDGYDVILSPCGRCREFMWQVSKANLETDVVLDKGKLIKLKDLLPYYDWRQKQD